MQNWIDEEAQQQISSDIGAAVQQDKRALLIEFAKWLPESQPERLVDQYLKERNEAR